MQRKFTKYPSSITASTDSFDNDVKSYIKELLDQGDDIQLIFELGGRFPRLTIKQFTQIIMDLYNDEGIKIPGIVY